MGTGPRYKRRNRSAALFGGILTTVTIAFVWTWEAPDGEANAVASGVARTHDPNPPASKADALPRIGSAASGFADFRDYFNPDLYGYYGYVSPPHSAWWAPSVQPISPKPGTPASGTTEFTTPSVGNLLEGYKAPDLSLSIPRLIAYDLPKLGPAAKVSISAAVSSPMGILTNTTPFHVFVTSDPVPPSSMGVSASAAVATGASLTSSSLSPPSASAIGNASSLPTVVAPVTGTVGTLFHR
jgi:hypothetical protein